MRFPSAHLSAQQPQRAIDLQHGLTAGGASCGRNGSCGVADGWLARSFRSVRLRNAGCDWQPAVEPNSIGSAAAIIDV
jgi:hypothetical protein